MPVPHPTNPRFENLTGRRFGRLIAVEYLGKKGTAALWRCVCDCGIEKVFHRSAIASGHTQSCGCIRKESPNRITHGMAGTLTYKTWAGMVQRCTNPNEDSFRHYGGRGIKIDPRWLDFDNFLADMGTKPKGMSIDRIDNNGNYEPGNCRWATPSQQHNNMRSNRLLTLNGRTQNVTQWANELGVKPNLIFQRLHYGWSDERTLTEPVRPC